MDAPGKVTEVVNFRPKRASSGRMSREYSVESDSSAKLSHQSSGSDIGEKEKDREGPRRSLTRESSKDSEGKVRHDDPKGILIARQKNPIPRSTSEGTYPHSTSPLTYFTYLTLGNDATSPQLSQPKKDKDFRVSIHGGSSGRSSATISRESSSDERNPIDPPSPASVPPRVSHRRSYADSPDLYSRPLLTPTLAVLPCP